ncbi:MAG: redoxin family protein [Planctomycetes bacterium]|nr:redoxin family protein [Planctomycetota bacterium]
MRQLIAVLIVVVAMVSGCAPRPFANTWPDGKPKQSGQLVGGKRVGAWTFTRADGSREAAGGWLDDKQDGAWTWWYADGTVQQRGAYARGLRTGPWEFFHANGKPQARGQYRADRQDGAWSWWDAQGVMLAEGDFVAGSKTPGWRFYEQGKLVADGTAPAASPDAPSIIVAPQPVLPGLWTQREEANVGKLVAAYSRGVEAGDGYFAATPAKPEPRAFEGKPLPITRLLAADGSVLDLAERQGQREVLLVVLRGFSGQVCIYCAAQTKAISQAMARFTARGTDVVFVYPGPAESVPVFLQAVQSLGVRSDGLLIALDLDLALVRALGIEYELAKPTSIILDRSGVVRYAYVGGSMTDRPSVDDLLAVLAGLGAPR